MRETIIALEAFSIMITLVVLYGNVFEVHNNKKRNRSYTVCVVLVVVAEFVDMLAWILNGRPELSDALFIINFLCYALGYLVSTYFMYYLWTLIGESHPLPRWTVATVELLAGPSILLVLVLSIRGKIFSIEEGFYVTQEWYPVSQVFTFFCMAWAFLLIILNAKYLGRRNTIACLSYIVMPAASMVLHIIYPQISLTYVAFAYSMLIIYVMIQAEYEREYKTRENSLIEASTRDALTGLYNRRAYDMACSQMQKFENVGIIFCDANGLKHTNDEFGHAAGDRLLLAVANGLIDIFSRNQVFRISGDEFVVMCPNMPYETFHAQGISLRAFIRRNGMPVASMGEAYGSGIDVYQLIKEAEQQMYLDKEQFYNDYPKMERRNR
ncbi:MAG: GGDEF domain-containing protein [Lachnospiraceae bacterium]|nr:GGDEF domain-containing protein [Lachnospiraceae bacterium]